MRTDKEIIESLEKINESFIKIDMYYNLDGSKFYGLSVCSRQLEKPFLGSSIREALSVMLNAIDPPNPEVQGPNGPLQQLVGQLPEKDA